VEFAIAIVWRLDVARRSLLEQQQDLPVTRGERAASFAKITNDAETKELLVERD
jgi:hypothetical protein